MIQTHSTARQGFSLMELMIAIAILAILAIVAVPNFLGYLESAKKSKATQTLNLFKSAITMYNAQIGKLPDRLQDLVKKPLDEAAAKKWQTGGYFEKQDLPLDPWNSDYGYKPTPGGKHLYELWSYGPNGKGSPEKEWISVWEL